MMDYFSFVKVVFLIVYRTYRRNFDRQIRPKVCDVRNHRLLRRRLLAPRGRREQVDVVSRETRRRIRNRNHDNRRSGLCLGNRVSQCQRNARILFSGS